MSAKSTYVLDPRSEYKRRYWIVSIFDLSPLIVALFSIDYSIGLFIFFTIPSLLWTLWTLYRSRRIEFYEDRIMFLDKKTVREIPYSYLAVDSPPISGVRSRRFKLLINDPNQKNLNQTNYPSFNLSNMKIRSLDNTYLHNWLYEKTTGITISSMKIPASSHYGFIGRHFSLFYSLVSLGLLSVFLLSEQLLGGSASTLVFGSFLILTLSFLAYYIGWGLYGLIEYAKVKLLIRNLRRKNVRN